MLEDIKERASKTALYQAEWAENYRSDVQYLLSIIEQQNETFDKLVKHAEDDTVANLHFSQLYVRRVCLDALKAIRGNLPKRGGLVNPDGGDYPLKWMSQKQDLE